LRFTTGITSIFLILLVTFNSFVAFFNLLPLGQLDGYKIFRWNVVIWSIMFIISIVLIIRIF
ncbi:MAG: peptidase M50, partial [Sulfolobaceae archaeon]